MDFNLHKIKPQDLMSATTLHCTGKATVQQGSYQIQGQYTMWHTYVYPGCYFYIPGDDYAYRISDVIDRFNIDLNIPYEGESRYVANYIIFRKAKEWFRCEPNKNHIAADGQDSVTLTGLPLGTLIHTTCLSQGVNKKEVTSSGEYEFKTTLPGNYNITLRKSGFYTSQILVEAV